MCASKYEGFQLQTMDSIKGYIKPHTLKETLSLLGEDDSACIIAGGTDLLLQDEKLIDSNLIDISDVADLVGISSSKTGLLIGASTKLSDIEKSSLLNNSLEVIKTAASMIGSPQIRNMATIGGNLCNASPSADMSSPLLVLDARVELMSRKSGRVLPISEFFIGPSQCALGQDEMMMSVHIPTPPNHAASTFLKHSVRKAMDMAIVSVSALMWRAEGTLGVRLGLSAVAPTPIRALIVEEYLSGQSSINEEILDRAATLAQEEVKPISDVRASERYRRAMVSTLTKRALLETYSRVG